MNFMFAIHVLGAISVLLFISNLRQLGRMFDADLFAPGFRWHAIFFARVFMGFAFFSIASSLMFAKEIAVAFTIRELGLDISFALIQFAWSMPLLVSTTLARRLKLRAPTHYLAVIPLLTLASQAALVATVAGSNSFDAVLGSLLVLMPGAVTIFFDIAITAAHDSFGVDWVACARLMGVIIGATGISFVSFFVMTCLPSCSKRCPEF